MFKYSMYLYSLFSYKIVLHRRNNILIYKRIFISNIKGFLTVNLQYMYNSKNNNYRHAVTQNSGGTTKLQKVKYNEYFNLNIVGYLV